MTTRPTTRSMLSAPGAPALLGSSVLARLPLAMFSIALLVHAQRLTGSFATAGIVTGAYAISCAVSAPVLGRLVDRCGQTRILIPAATVTALALLSSGLLPVGAPPLLLVGLAVGAGLATPPLEPCVRALLPAMVEDPAALPGLFALESTVLELTFILGPPLALGLGALWSTGTALGLSGVVLLLSTLVFALRPASRRWRPTPQAPGKRGGSLRSPAIRTLVLIELGTGVVFGAVDVGVTASTRALGSTVATGPLLGLWGLGSLLGGIAATRLGGGARRGSGLVWLLAALAVSHGALILTTGSGWAIGAVILLAGATIAPTAASVYAMVDRAAPAGSHTEAFAWLVSASSTGAAAGAALAGLLAQSGGAVAAFAFVGVMGGLTVLIAALGRRSLDRATPDVGPDPYRRAMRLAMTSAGLRRRRAAQRGARTPRPRPRTVCADHAPRGDGRPSADV